MTLTSFSFDFVLPWTLCYPCPPPFLQWSSHFSVSFLSLVNYCCPFPLPPLSYCFHPLLFFLILSFFFLKQILVFFPSSLLSFIVKTTFSTWDWEREKLKKQNLWWLAFSIIVTFLSHSRPLLGKKVTRYVTYRCLYTHYIYLLFALASDSLQQDVAFCLSGNENQLILGIVGHTLLLICLLPYPTQNLLVQHRSVYLLVLILPEGCTCS